MYTPSFLEIFLAFGVVAWVSHRIAAQPAAPAFTRWIPWVAGAAVTLGLVVGSLAVLQGSPGSATVLANLAKQGAAAAVAITAITAMVAGGITFGRRQRNTS